MSKMLLFFSNFSSNLLLFSASQQDLQATTDQRLFDNLFASFSILDQAHLMALSHLLAQVAAGLKLSHEFAFVWTRIYY